MRKIIGVIIILLLASSTIAADDIEYFSYNEFIEMVENDRIVSVEVDRFSSIDGFYVKDGEKYKFSTYTDTGSSNDPLLIRLLKKHNVSVAINYQDEPDQSYSFFYSFTITLLPIATFIYILLLNIKLNKIIKNMKRN